jgi:hypothetical protein
VALQVAEMKKETETPQPKYRKDYKPTPYLVENVKMDFNLQEDSTRVITRSSIKPNHKGMAGPYQEHA